MHPAVQVEHRPAAVARLDRHGQLDHLHAVKVAPRRDDPLHEAELKPVRRAHGHHRRALLKGVRVSERQRRQAGPVDAQHGQVERAIPSVNGGHLRLLAAGQPHAHRPPLARHVQARGDQAVAGDHEAGPHAFLLVIPAELREHYDRVADALGQLLGVQRLWGGQLLRGRRCFGGEQAKRGGKNRRLAKRWPEIEEAHGPR